MQIDPSKKLSFQSIPFVLQVKILYCTVFLTNLIAFYSCEKEKLDYLFGSSVYKTLLEKEKTLKATKIEWIKADYIYVCIKIL